MTTAIVIAVVFFIVAVIAVNVFAAKNDKNYWT